MSTLRMMRVNENTFGMNYWKLGKLSKDFLYSSGTSMRCEYRKIGLIPFLTRTTLWPSIIS
ncbi:hypothetical protein Hanom_Chr01g00045131 [Helianthus anomalus]